MNPSSISSSPNAKPSGLEAKLQDVSLPQRKRNGLATFGKHLLDSFKGIFYDPIKSDVTVNKALAQETLEKYVSGNKTVTLGALAAELAEKDRTFSRKTAQYVFDQLYENGVIADVQSGLSKKERKQVLKNAIKQYYQAEGKSVRGENLKRFANHYVRPIGMGALMAGSALHTGGASLALMAAMDVAEIGAMTYIPKLAREKGWKDGEYKVSSGMLAGLSLLQIPRFLAGDARALANIGRYSAGLASLVQSRKAQQIAEKEGTSREYYHALHKAETWSAVAAGLLGVSGALYTLQPGYVHDVQKDWQHVVRNSHDSAIPREVHQASVVGVPSSAGMMQWLGFKEQKTTLPDFKGMHEYVLPSKQGEGVATVWKDKDGHVYDFAKSVSDIHREGNTLTVKVSGVLDDFNTSERKLYAELTTGNQKKVVPFHDSFWSDEATFTLENKGQGPAQLRYFFLADVNNDGKLDKVYIHDPFRASVTGAPSVHDTGTTTGVSSSKANAIPRVAGAGKTAASSSSSLWRHPEAMNIKKFDAATMYKHKGELFFKEENDIVSNVYSQNKNGLISVLAKDELLKYGKNHHLVWKLAYDANNDRKLSKNEVMTANFNGKHGTVFKIKDFVPTRKFYLGAFDTDNKQWIASVANRTKADEIPAPKPPHVPDKPLSPSSLNKGGNPVGPLDYHPLTGNYWYELKHKYPGATYLDEMIKDDYGTSVARSAEAAGDNFSNLLKDLTVGHDIKTNTPGYVIKHGATGLLEGVIGHGLQRVGNLLTFGAIPDPDGYSYNGNPLKWIWNIPRTVISYAWNDVAKPVTHIAADATYTVTNTAEVPLKTVLGVVPEGRIAVDATGNIVQGTTTALTDYFPVGGDAIDHRVHWWAGKFMDGKFPKYGTDFNPANPGDYHRVYDPAGWRGAVNPFYTNTPTRNVMEHLGPVAVGSALYNTGIGLFNKTPTGPSPTGSITGGTIISGR